MPSLLSLPRALLRRVTDIIHPTPTTRAGGSSGGNTFQHCDSGYRALQDFGRDGQADTLDTATAHFRQAIAQGDSAQPLRAAVLWGLGACLRLRCARTRAQADYDDAIAAQRETLKAENDCGYYTRSSTLNDLADTLLTRFDARGDLQDVEEAIALQREALALSTSDDVGPITFGLAKGLAHRYQRLGDIQDLHEAVDLNRQALVLLPADDDLRPIALGNLAAVLATTFEVSGALEDLDEAIRLQTRNLGVHPAGHPERADALHNLSTFLVQRYERVGDIADLDESMKAHRECVLLRAPGDPRRPAALNGLANVYKARFERLGTSEDLNEAITLYQTAIEASSGPGVLTSARSMCNLAGTLRARFENSGVYGDLQEAIDLDSKAQALYPISHPQRASALTSLASSFQARFYHVGNVVDLDEAVRLQREVLDLRPAGNPRRYKTLSNLATVVHARVVRAGASDELPEAIALYRAALALCPVGHPGRPGSLSDLAKALRTRFELAPTETDLQEALTLYSEALTYYPSGHPHRSFLLHNVANCFLTGFLVYRSPENIEQSINLQREALSLCEPQSQFRAACAENLGMSYYARSVLFKNVEDSAQALQLTSEALDALPPGRGERSKCLRNIAQLYLEPQAPYYHVKTALRYLIDSLTDRHGSAQLRLIGAVDTLEKIRREDAVDGDSRELLLDVYNHTIQLLPEVAYFGLEIQSRLKALKRAENLSLEAASHALLLGRAPAAIEILEEGRAIFWTQALRLRTQLDDVPDDIREELITLTRGLECDSFQSRSTPQKTTTKITEEQDAARRRRQSEKLSSLVEDVRNISGLEGFMKRETFDTLSRAAEMGPVVILVASKLSCDAILMVSGCEPTTVHLPSVDTAWLEKSSLSLTDDNRNTRDVVDDETSRAVIKVLPLSLQALSILEQLWIKVVKPILGALGLKPSSGSDRPRLWWCPTGQFNFIPLHAAGEYGAKGGSCCTDYIVSSYTPTLCALLTARRSSSPILRDTVKVLLAAVPKPFRGTSLPSTVKEIEAVRSVVPIHSLTAVPAEDDPFIDPSAGATVQTMLDMLPSTVFLHLACHGHQNAQNPLESGFIMRDGVLTIARLMPVPLPRASLAFLSACETAKGDQGQPDQTVHLAATMLFVGFKSVVATMWSMYDLDGPIVARNVYEHLFDGDLNTLDLARVPYALDAAVQELRAKGLHPSRWAPYIHIGA